MNGLKSGIIISVLLLIFAFTASSIFLQRNKPRAQEKPYVPMTNANYYEENNWLKYEDEKVYSFFYPSSWNEYSANKEKGTKKFFNSMCIMSIRNSNQVQNIDDCNTNPKLRCKLIDTANSKALIRHKLGSRPSMSAEIANSDSGSTILSLEYRSDICLEQFRSIVESFSNL